MDGWEKILKMKNYLDFQQRSDVPDIAWSTESSVDNLKQLVENRDDCHELTQGIRRVGRILPRQQNLRIMQINTVSHQKYVL